MILKEIVLTKNFLQQVQHSTSAFGVMLITAMLYAIFGRWKLTLSNFRNISF